MAGCDNHAENDYHVEYSERAPSTTTHYVVGIQPMHNPVRLHEVFQPLIDLLNAQFSGVDFTIEASRNYADYNRKLNAGRFDFALPNPYQTLQALSHGYRLIGKMADGDHFRGIILVRRESGINKLSDLRGKTVAFPAPTALASAMMPQWFLHQHGLDVGRDYEARYVGSQESSIMSVQLGYVAAAATSLDPWQTLLAEQPELGKALEARWVTEALPGNGLIVREDIPQAHVQKVSQVLFNLQQNAQERGVLRCIIRSGFVPATKASYQPVQDFVTRFRQELRPLDATP